MPFKASDPVIKPHRVAYRYMLYFFRFKQRNRLIVPEMTFKITQGHGDSTVQ